MRNLFKSSFLWQFTGGFVIGTVGLLALQPGDARAEFARHFTPGHVVQAQR